MSAMQEAARQYADAGYALAAWDRTLGKGPRDTGWGLEAYSPDDVTDSHNIGMNHALSRTAVLDADDLELTRQVLESFDVDVDALAQATMTWQGNPDNRMKLAFRCDDGLNVKKLVIERGGRKHTVFELRGAAPGKQSQDVLPPSIHPDTHRPYQFITGIRRRDALPEIPAALLELWRNWKDLEQTMKWLAGCDATRELPTKTKITKTTGDHGDVIGHFNRRFTTVEIIERNGYQKIGRRWLHPDSTTKVAGVIQFDDGCLYAHGGGALADDKPHDAFDCFRILEHNGDMRAAVKAAATLLGLPRQVPNVSRPPLPEQGGAIPAGLTVTDTDIANARRLIARYGGDLRYTPERGWVAWDGRRWAVDEKSLRVLTYAKRTALEIFDEVKDAADRDMIYKHAKRSQSKIAIQSMEWLARSEAPASITDFDADPWLLNVENGTINLRTGELRPHERADLITKLAPVVYDREADCPTWRATLERIFDRDSEIIEYLRRLVGYGLTGVTVEQVIHFLWGMGANGKSTVSELVQEMLGDYATVCSPDLIMTRRHGGIPNDVARLRGVRLAVMNETGQGARFDEAKLKDLTGGDRLTARFLHAEFFDFRPTHKLIIRGNHKPAITGTDEGIWRRLRLVPFTVVIPPDERDPYLLDKLRAELPGVLRWAVEGCLAWQRDGLRPPAAVLTAVSTYRDEADTLGRFVAECCTVRNLAQVKASAFQKSYATYCREADERPIPSKDLPAELERRGYRYQRTKVARLYLGLELTVENDAEDRWHGLD